MDPSQWDIPLAMAAAMGPEGWVANCVSHEQPEPQQGRRPAAVLSPCWEGLSEGAARPESGVRERGQKAGPREFLGTPCRMSDQKLKLPMDFSVTTANNFLFSVSLSQSSITYTTLSVARSAGRAVARGPGGPRFPSCSEGGPLCFFPHHPTCLHPPENPSNPFYIRRP